MQGVLPLFPGALKALLTPEGSEKLWAVLILSGAISMVATIIPMLFYKVTESKQREYVKEIEERKAAKAAKTAE